jgi:hypothetical protein
LKIIVPQRFRKSLFLFCAVCGVDLAPVVH